MLRSGQYITSTINSDKVQIVVRPVAEAKDLALFFDTFERTSDFVDSWLRAVLEGQHGDMPGNIVLIIAGRNELAKSKWTPFEGLIARLSLEPFTDEEALDYLNRRGITDEQVVETILKLSGQLPLIMATLAVGGASNPEDVGDPSGDAVDRFLKWVEDPKQRQVALDAALLRFLNRDLLAILVGEEEADAYFNWLKKMPFVQERAKGWVYHSVVRQPMLRYKYRETPQGWTETQRLLAEHFEKLLDNLGLDEEAKWRDETWQDYSLNALYHRLCQMPRQHLPVAINDFVEALQVQRDVAIRWAEVMHQAGLDGADADVEAWGERLVEVLKAHKENRYDDAASVFSMLQQYPKLRSKWQPLILGYRGRTYLLMGRYEEALTDFDKVIELDPENAGAYGGRGLTYSLMGRYEEALTDYDKTIELDPENAGAYGGRGETYRLMGRYEEALTDYDKTIELDPENTWVYGSRGEMYRLMERYEEALTDYDKVIELDPENALAYGIRGVTYRLMERYQEALEDFNKAIELNPDSDWIFYQRALLYRILGKEKEASVDITAAIQINQPKYGEAPQDFHNTLRPSIT